jgi:dimethylhistidine N-methyltransferase
MAICWTSISGGFLMKTSKNKIELIDLKPSLNSLKTEVLAGLKKPQKKLSAKFFYDKHGSELFDKITKLDEYYLTSTEESILQQHITEIDAMIDQDDVLIEFGSGSSTKIRIFLDQVKRLDTYMPIDISKEFLKESAEVLANDYPDLDIIAVCADYTKPFQLPEVDTEGKKVVFFPGSTIGNFEPVFIEEFLQKVSKMLRPQDSMIIGVDLKKDESVLNAAYNDAHGVTAAFNLNILNRINEELDANFDLTKFAHKAFYNAEYGRVEMHLKSVCLQTVSIEGELIEFEENETIHTENSHKFTVSEFQKIASDNGFLPSKVWLDPKNYFSVHYLTVK